MAGIFEHKVIAVTGAGSGIGRALALNLAEKGAVLALADKDPDGLAETKRLLGNRPASITALDVTDTDALAAWVDGAAAEFGRLDGIVNNAGLSVVAPFADCPRDDFNRVMAVNFGGVVEGCRAAIPHMRKSDQGYPTQSAYNASKYAVRGLTEALYLELGVTDPNICVIRVHPGGVKTNVARNSKRVAAMPGTPTDLDFAAEFEKAAKTTPEQAAAIIVDGMARKQHRVLIGSDAKFIDLMTRLFPVHYFKRIGAFIGGGNR